MKVAHAELHTAYTNFRKSLSTSLTLALNELHFQQKHGKQQTSILTHD